MNAKRSKSLSPEPSSSREAKIPKLDDDNLLSNGKLQCTQPHILDFSDDVLLNIMKFLYPQDLLALSLCCQRLNQVTRDRTLWRRVDFRSRPTTDHDLKSVIKFLQPHTRSIAINGKHSEPNSNEDRLEELKIDFVHAIDEMCPNLKELVIEEYSIISDKIKITDFPSTLEKFSLKGTKVRYITTPKSYFFKMDLHMQNLTTLIVSDCQWLTGHYLLVISKIPKLKELRLDSCKRLGDWLAYCSLATRFGFKTLEILDLRRTIVGDSEIRCLSNTKTLTHLYLEYPPDLSESNNGLDQLRRDIFQEPTYEDRIARQYNVDENQFAWEDLSHCRVSDRSICALGSYVCDRSVLDDSRNGSRYVLVIEEEVRLFNNPNLKTLVVKNYPLVTNKSLVHLAANAHNLEYLDVTGTSVTESGVQTFKSQRPEVKLVSYFYTDI